ncbi:hypothetical protein [Lysinibacillus sp. NPDC047702]|uniref:hypothetical protein n=1 Tax=unclassified Lysinibacillus TaxID=2636778 RepID=UPI003CFBE220
MKKTFVLLSIIIGGLYLVYGIIKMISNFKNYTTADFIVVTIVLLFVVLLELFLIIMFKKTFNRSAEEARNQLKLDREKEKFERESKILGSKARQQLLGADFCIQVKHMAGLPIAEGADVYVYRCSEKVIFERNQDTIELNVTKMRDILIKTDVEIQKSYSSSIGGAVGGYVLFGPLGAMVGGRSKEKKSTVVEKYLIFAYTNKEGNQDYISFEVTNEPNAILFNSSHYDLSKSERMNIEL